MRELLQRSKVIGLIVLAVLTLIVVLQNTESVETRILFMKLVMPRAALLFGTLVIGFVLGMLVAGRMMSRRKAD